MKIGIVGSRDFNDYEMMKDIILNVFSLSESDCIVSGGASGADTLAEKLSKEFNTELKVFPANWTRDGKSAGYKRNIDIISNSNFVFAFWDGISKGTNHSITLCHKMKKPHMVLFFKQQTNNNLEDFFK